jgi:hypothetical protein
MTGAKSEQNVTLLILVVDDEPDVEMLFRQHFRRDLREGRFTMEFAQCGTWRFSASVMRRGCRSS